MAELQQAIDFTVTFNIEKCQFATETIDFFTEYGLRADPNKVQAIKECNRPNSKEVVCSLMGMAGYLDNFKPNYAAIAAPLRILTRDINFQWTDKEDQVSMQSRMQSAACKRWHSMIPSYPLSYKQKQVSIKDCQQLFSKRLGKENGDCNQFISSAELSQT